MLLAPLFQVLRGPGTHYKGTHYTVDSISIEGWMGETQYIARSDTMPYSSLPSKIEILRSSNLKDCPLLKEKDQKEDIRDEDKIISLPLTEYLLFAMCFYII